MKKILHYLAIVVLLLCSSQILGQLYPVQVIPQVIPPYTNKLVEYTDGSVNRIQLQLVTTDLTVINRPVYLKMYIEGNGIKAQSRDLIQGTHPLFITGGDMISLSNLELTPYFQLRNLEGISQNTYANPLADGMYHICFEVYDVVTRKRLSQKNCSSMYLVLNDPPMLNLPMDREQVNQTDFTHLLFSWTPRQINALNVSYTFELKEVRDPNLAPSYAFDMAPVLYKEEGIRSTTLLYDLLKPSLVAGKRYAWRVKATSFNGLAENSVFKNNGYSEIRSFSIAVNCGAPTMLLAQDNGRHAVRLTWAGAPTHLKYHVQYRKTGIAGAAWFDRYVVNNQTILTDLEPGFTYEFRVGGTCEPEVYPAQPNYTYSPTAEFTLEQTDNHDQGFSCGLKADTQITNHQPITNLVVNESFYAGDFTVKILDLKGTGSTVYTGVGSIYVPYLGITLAVEFRNIQINTDYQLIHGVVETVYDANWENVHNTNELNPKEEVHQEVDFVIDEITTDSQGNPKVIGTEGEELILEKNKDYTLVDKEGNVWTIASDFDGEESITSPTGEKATSGIPTAANTKGIGKEGEVTAFTAKGVRIHFENASTANYAFDDASGASSSPKYGRLYKQVKGEYLRYKAVVNGEEDKVIARVQFEGEPIALDSLDFKTAAGAAIAFSKLSDREYELTVKGSFNYAEDQIMAVFKPAGEQQYVVAGAMQLIHLNAITLPLRLVPTTSTVNGEQLKQAIIAQYNRVGVTVEAEVLAPYLHGQLAVSEVSRDDKEFLNRYTPSEDRFIAEYFSNYEQEAAFYLFISDQAGGQYGRMPIQSQFGFITDPNGLASMAMTATHELGHGAFELQHPFTQYTTTPGQANSMMDLPPTTDFNQVDWKQMNLRKFSLKTVVQQKEDGARNVFSHFGITPTGEVFDAFYKDGSRINITVLLAKNYVIETIEYDGLEYQWNASSRAFIRDHAKIEIKRVEKDLNDRVNLFRGRGDGCMYDYVTVVWDQEDEKVFNVQERIAEKIAVLKESDWTLSPLDIRDSSCGNLFIKELLARDLQDCNEVELNAGIVRLKEAIGLSDAKEVVRIVNQTCFAAIRNLSYNEIQTLIQRVASQTSIKEQSELAILRLMTAIKANDYMAFYRYLETNNNAVLKHLIAEMDDASIWFLTDKKNYTNFIGALVTMFTSNIASIADRWPTVEDDYAKRVINLNAIDYSSDVTSIFSPVFTSKHNIGTYDSTTGTIKLYDVYTTYTYGSVNAHNDGRHVQEHKDLVAEVSPLTPLIVIPKKGKLPLVATALGEPILDNNQYLVPAILLKYQEDKERNDYIEKGVVTTLDLATISLSGGVALSTKVNWVRRAWALAEVAGSVGNIAVNAQAVDSNSDLGKAIDIYNLAMGTIGVKNVAVGGYQFVRTLPDATKELLQKNKGLRDVLTAQYLEWNSFTIKFKSPESYINSEVRKVIEEQESIFGLLSGKVLHTFNDPNEITQYLKTDKDGAFFWSGRTSKGEGVMDMALDIAKSKGGNTLEGLLAKYNVDMPIWKIDDAKSIKIWDDVSGIYAMQVSGEVRAVLGKSLRPGNVWERIELPRLKKNPKVTKIITIDPETMIETVIHTK